ncbi:MAG: DUF362 domain-containing protein [Candidatus Bathyarchaeia archaeon]
MGAVQVYWSDARAPGFGQGLLDKVEKLWEVADFDQLIEPGDRVAVKLHMGEGGTTRYLRPVFARRVVDLIRSRARGRPFVTDTCTADYSYWVRRATGQEHLMTVAAHGFTSESMNAPVVIADGVAGRDDVELPITGAKHLKKTLAARGIVEADALIALTHVKGHRFGVMGGSIKNLGIGCVSQRGKLNVHSPEKRWKVKIDLAKCEGCDWRKYCAQCRMGALSLSGDGLAFNPANCGFDLWCWLICSGLAGRNAVTLPDPDGRGYLPNFQEAMTESALAIARSFKPGKVGFLNFCVDVTPLCDCASFADLPFMADQGVYASLSNEDNAEALVAVDKASLQAVNDAPGLQGTAAEEQGCLDPGSNKLKALRGADPWIQIQHAESLLGRKVEYTLQKVEMTRADILRLARRLLDERESWYLWG